MLVDPAAHEPAGGDPWSAERARRAIAAIVADAERAFDADALWPAHPADLDGGPLPAPTTLYLGAAGVVWALDELQRCGAAEPGRDWTAVADGLHERYLARPDFPELTDGLPVPSFWMGEAGVLLLGERLAPAPWRAERLLACVEANADHPSRELLWGAPGTMIAAAAMHARTGEERWASAWRASADRLWATWEDPVWEQHLYGTRRHYLGPAHGFAGNVLALAQGELLDAQRRAELEHRALAVAHACAQREGDVAQWPPTLEPPSGPVRTQWCHGAPGMVTSLAPLAPGDASLTELLVAGGELTWRAGPLVKGPGLCHGTAGNGHALLALFERTGDERWLRRARVFAAHAAAQVERERRAHGRGRHTLWTGDLGVALFLNACADGRAGLPALDRC